MTSAAKTPRDRPLDGVLVVSLEQAVAAPMCSSMLAQAGARVIKVERPEGDFARAYDNVVHGESAYFVWLNGHKESIRINLKHEPDRALLLRMVSKADVFIQNLAPGAAARHGVGSRELREIDPRLITVDISGYGEEGEYSHMKAYDLLIQGESGLASVTGTREEPGRIGVSICDIACGMYAYSGVLEALIQREATGLGDSIKLSLFAAAANWMTVPLLHYDYAGVAPARDGLRHPSIAPYGVFNCIDGKQVLIAVQNQREWADFCATVLDDPGLAEAPRFATNPKRVANRADLERLITSRLAGLDRDELHRRLERGKIAHGGVNTVGDLSRHPQPRRATGGSPSEPVELVAAPVQHSAWMPAFAASPGLGEHDERLRSEFTEQSDELQVSM